MRITTGGAPESTIGIPGIKPRRTAGGPRSVIDGSIGVRSSGLADAIYSRGLAGAVPQNQVSDARKNQISRWAKAASQSDDRLAYLSAVSAMASTQPWDDQSPWYTAVDSGGWYRYSDISTMMSTTIAERHPDWVSAVTATLPWAVPGLTAVNPDAGDAVVNAFGSTLDDAGSGAAGTLKAGTDAVKDAFGTAGTIAVVAGVGLAITLVAMSFAQGRGLRSNPFRARRRAGRSR